MKTETYQRDRMSAGVQRVALVLVCVVLFAIFGIAAPYRIYKYYETRQDSGTATAFHEEL